MGGGPSERVASPSNPGMRYGAVIALLAAMVGWVGLIVGQFPAPAPAPPAIPYSVARLH